MNWENLAKAGYEVYWQQLRQSQHDSIPLWTELNLQERMAWIAAAKEITDIFARVATA